MRFDIKEAQIKIEWFIEWILFVVNQKRLARLLRLNFTWHFTIFLSGIPLCIQRRLHIPVWIVHLLQFWSRYQSFPDKLLHSSQIIVREMLGSHHPTQIQLRELHHKESTHNSWLSLSQIRIEWSLMLPEATPTHRKLNLLASTFLED